MTAYGNFQNDRSQRKFLEAVAAGTNELPASALGPGSVARSVADELRDIAVPVTRFGAVGDGVAKTGGSIDSASTTLTVSSGAFVSDDVGKTIIIQGAGAAGVDLNTTIATVTSSTVVVISVAASTTVSGAIVVYGTNDAPAFKAAFEWAINQDTSKRDYVSHNSQSIAGTTLQVNGPAVYVPAGTYIWGDTTGWTRSGAGKTLQLYGAGKAATRIEMGGVDDYFLKVADFIYGRFADMTLIGGKGFFKSTTTGSSVYRGMYFEQLGVHRFSECGIGRLSDDWPLFSVRDCDFQPTTINTAIGVALSGLTDESEIVSCSFYRCKYGVKIGKGGNNLKLYNNFLTRTVSGGASIWVVPHTSATNGGQGFDAFSNKFGNESATSGAYAVLVADEGSGTDFCSKQHATTASTGFWMGAKLRCSLHNGATAGAAPSLVYSYTPHISGMEIINPYIYGSLPTYIIEYDAVVSSLNTGWHAKNNLILFPNVDQLGSNLTAPIRASNLAGAAQVVDPLGVVTSNLGFRSDYGRGYPSDFTDISSVLGNALTAGPHSVATFTTSSGLIGGEWTLANSSTALVGGNLNASFTDGRLTWLEIELQQGATQSLTSVLVQIRRKDSSTVYEFSRPVYLPTNLTRFTFPFVIPAKASDAIRVGVVPQGWGAGVTDKVRIGQIRVYHAEHPVPWGNLQTYGSNAGAYNGAHWINGSYHFWMSGAQPRYHSAAPSAATDGLPASPLFIGSVTWSGSGATTTATVTGAATTDLVYATIKTKPTQAAYLVRAAITSSNTLTLELSAANTSNDAVISYMVFRP